MKRTLIFITLLCCAATICHAISYANETLTYRVMYKWGLINKQAGAVKINIHSAGDNYAASLTAASQPWADKIFRVRDTLTSTIAKSNLQPSLYIKNSHEGSEDKHDVVKFTRKGATVVGDCVRRVHKKGKLTTDEKRQVSAAGTTVDMLSSFYYLRALKFDTWKQGQVLTINIFSGKSKERLTFKYRGIETIELNEKKHTCYHVTFIFTGDDGTKTSDDMDAWISTDAARIPLKLEGELPVGKVQCFYTGKL